MTIDKPMRNELPRPITREANSTMNQSEFLAITSNFLKAGENRTYKIPLVFLGFSCVQIFKSITECGNRNRVITLDRIFRQSFENCLLGHMIVLCYSGFFPSVPREFIYSLQL